MHPLDMHAQAAPAAKAALAAHAQGKYFEMHAKLYENSSSLSRDKILEIASSLGLDMDRFKKDWESPAIKTAIDQQTKEVVDIGATGTPASFVNGRYVSGAKPYDFFKVMVDEELKWARESNRPAFVTGKNVREALPAASPAAAQGPDPAKVYDFPVGGAPVAGPSTAKVTILHYLDYQ